MSGDELRERLRAAIPEESPIDREAHLDAIQGVVERAKESRELPIEDLFARVRERSQ